MQIELTASLLIEAATFFLLVGGAIITAAVMIKGTAKDLKNAVDAFKEETAQRRRDHDRIVEHEVRLDSLEEWSSRRGMRKVVIEKKDDEG